MPTVSLTVGRIQDQADFVGPLTAGYYLQWNGSDFVLANVPAAPVQSVNGQIGSVTLTTTNIAEGSNLYYSDARADARITLQKDAPNGVATLDASGKVVTTQIPAVALVDTFVVASQADMLALTAQTGDVAIRTDISQSFILQGTDSSVLANWVQILNPAAPVQSVFGRIGSVVPVIGDYSAIAQAGASVTTNADGSITIAPVAGKNVALSSGQFIGPSSGDWIFKSGNAGTDTIFQDGNGIEMFRCQHGGGAKVWGPLSLVSTSTVTWGDLFVVRDAPNILALRNGVNPQSFRLYNTYTDVNNGEWLDVFWVGNTARIRTTQNGTGGARQLAFGTNNSDRWLINTAGHLLGNIDNTYDIGGSANRPRNLYLGSQALLSDGTIAAPSYTFISETNTGIYRPTTNTLGLSAGGSHVVWLSTAASLIKLRGDYGLAFCSGDASTTADTVLRRDAPNTIALRNVANAQTFRVYNTYTDASNGEWLETSWAGNVCTLTTKANGTGVVRNLSFPGKVLAGGVDLGASQLNVYNGVSTSSPVLACQLNNVADGTTIFMVSNGGTSPFTVRGIYASLTSTSNAIFGIQQNGTGNAVMDILMVGTVGDGFLRCGLNGGAAWSAGIKQSDGSFRIAPGNSFATAAVLTLTTTTATFAANVLVAGGTVLAPGLAFSSETGLGFYRPGAQTIGLVGAGSEFLRLDTASVAIAANNILAWGSNGIAGVDTVLRRDAANTLAMRNGVNAQTFRLYGTYTDVSNYERFTADYDATAGNFRLRSLAAGTGQARGLYLDGAYALRLGSGGFVRWEINATGLVANNDNTYDIGASGASRPRSLYIGTGLDAPTVTLDTITPRTTNVTLSSGQLMLPDGSAALPSVALGSAPTLGWAKIVNNRWSFIQLGLEKIQLGGNLFLGSDVGLAWMPTAAPGSSTADVVLQRDAPSILAQRSGGIAQTFKIYNTYTDASNYQCATVGWLGGVLLIGSENAGTGVGANVVLQRGGQSRIRLTGSTIQLENSPLIFLTDNAFDIGASGVNRPRNLYLAGAVATKVKAGTPTDADFTNPVDGMIAIDSTNSKIWVRISGVWKGVVVT